MQLENRGVATATIVTSGFVRAAEAHRRLLKHPELPYFAVPHPLVSNTDDALRASADAIFDAAVKALTRAGKLVKS